MAAVSGRIVQTAVSARQSKNLRLLISGKICAVKLHRNVPPQGLGFTSTDMLAMQKSTSVETKKLLCNASQSGTAVSSFEKVNFLKLQNGSDIRGVAVEGVEGESVSLTEPVTEAISAAFAGWLSNKKKSEGSKRLRVSIGHDSRISAKNLQDAASRGLVSAGIEVIHYGLASTPAMFNSTLTQDEANHCPVDGAIMITASHLPYNRNGFKFFTSEGGLGKPDIKDILQRASSIYDKLSEGGVKVSNKDVNASVKKVDYMSIYTSDLVAAVRKAAGNKEKPLEGFHIIVDAGNGSGGFFAIFPEQLFDAQGIVQHNFSFNRKTTFLLDRCLCTTSAEETAKVLEPLGAVTIGSQFLEPDGMFPNHIPNPEDKTAMQAITKAVLDNKADLGIIFDTDVDRSAAVDSTGRELNRNRLIALMAAIVLEEHPGTTIVTDSVTSDGLTTFIENKLGGKHHRFKRGYKNVIDEAIRLNSTGEESHLAMETSGHGALKENHWLDDGAYLMVKLLNKLAAAKSEDPSVGSEILTDMIDGLEEAAVAVEIRLKIDQNHADLKGGSFRDYGEAVLKHMDSTIESYPQLKKAVKNFEGVRASGNGGWFLLRLSLHDPVLPLNIEAPSNEDALKLGLAVLNVVKEFPALDISALSKFIQQF